MNRDCLSYCYFSNKKHMFDEIPYPVGDVIVIVLPMAGQLSSTAERLSSEENPFQKNSRGRR